MANAVADRREDLSLAPQEVTPDVRHSPEHMAMMLRARVRSGHLGGRPTKYEPWMPRATFEILAAPNRLHPLSYVAACLGIAPSTLQDWRGEHEEFEAAASLGLAVQESNMVSMLIRPPQGVSISGLIFALKNSAHRYKDKVEQETKMSMHQELAEQLSKAQVVDWDHPILEPVGEERRLLAEKKAEDEQEG